MGRKILRCGPRMTNEVVRGELGWGTLKEEETRWYWGEKNERIPKKIYKESRKRMEEEETKGEIKTKTWCKYTRDLLRELELEEYFDQDCIFDKTMWRMKVEKENTRKRGEIVERRVSVKSETKNLCENKNET
jgi:hypothetical protein